LETTHRPAVQAIVEDDNRMLSIYIYIHVKDNAGQRT
jgi:hypothetical protein